MPAHTGVLLINIGTPSAPTRKAVKRYLSRFLFDKRVITIPSAPRFLLVKGIIAPFRSKKSAKEYQRIWSEKGSPLQYYSDSLCKKLQNRLGNDFKVFFAMRYSNPDIGQTLAEMHRYNFKQIIVIPQYPQNASSTTGSSLEEVFRQFCNWNEIPGIHIIPPFFDRPQFIKLWAKRVMKANPDNYDAVLFSYHGLPESHLKDSHLTECDIKNCDCEFTHGNYHCYKAQCIETSRLIASEAEVSKDKIYTSFQSRFSKNWIGPFTDEKIKQLASEGNKRILVLCPAFVTDCLETIAEIGMDLRDSFLDAGGTDFKLLTCLNNQDDWADVLKEFILDK